jgi:hypothetical protein
MKIKAFMYWKSRINIFYWIIFGLVSFIVHPTQSQIIQGRVVDSVSDEGLPYVNIVFPRLLKGTVSNAEGGFSFSIPKEAKESDTLRLSHIGYEDYRITVAVLKEKPMHVFRMAKSTMELNAAIVLAYKPREIMKRFQANMENTFYPDPHEFDVFYREVIKVNDEYAGFARSAGYMHCEGFHPRHAKMPSTSGRDIHYNTFFQTQKSDYALLTTKTGSVRNSFWYFPNYIYKMFGFRLGWFEYQLMGEQYIGDRPVFVLRIFSTDSGLEEKASRWGYSNYKLLQSATFHIDQADYGLHKMQLNWKNTAPIAKLSGREYKTVTYEESAMVNFQRSSAGRYLFNYANYSSKYRGFGYKAEGFPDNDFVEEFYELYAMDVEFVDMSYEELRARYIYGLRGDPPFRSLMYVPDLYNGFIFIPGRSTYDVGFWDSYKYPAQSYEKEMEAALSKKRPLQAQYEDFTNNQLYILGELKKRSRLTTGYWARTSLSAY